MISRTEIQNALQYDFSPVSDPINAGGDPPYRFTYQFAGTEQPADLRAPYNGWAGVDGAQEDAVRDALDHIESFLNVDFAEVDGQSDPDVNIGRVSLDGNTAGSGGPTLSRTGDGRLVEYDGHAVFDRSLDISDNQGVIVHELGHALGLKHPFQTQDPFQGISDATTLPERFDTNKYTVMSYDENPATGEDDDTAMLFDILALQERWGATTDTATGDTTYDGPRNAGVDVIWDGGGTDKLDAGGRDNDVLLDLREGAFSRFGEGEADDVAIAYEAVIEDAVGGAGADTLTGNDAANRLFGGAGDDELTGGSNDDTLSGGTGSDTLELNSGRDQVVGALDELDGDIIRDFGSDDAIVVTDTRVASVTTEMDGEDRLLRLDADGDGGPEAALRLEDAADLGSLSPAYSENGTTITTSDNSLPVAVDDTLPDIEGTSGSFDTSTLLANDTDGNGDPLAVTAVSDATGGTVALADETISFTAREGFTGDASFEYTIADGAGGTASGTAMLRVGEAPEPSPDGDDDGIEDDRDNAIGFANPNQRDTDGDGYGNVMDADFDGNGSVGIEDLGFFRDAFGATGLSESDPRAHADLSDTVPEGGASVGIDDLGRFRDLFGQPLGESAVADIA